MKLLMILTIFFVFQFSTNIYSQTTTFSKALDVLNLGDYGDELELHNGNYYITGRGVVWDSITEKVQYPDYFLVLDSSLNKINTYVMQEAFYGTDLYFDSDTFYYCGITDKIWQIYKFDLNGDSLDMISIDTFKNFVGKKAGVTKIISKGDDFYLEGFLDRNSIGTIDYLVMKTDRVGQIKKIEKFQEFLNPKYLNSAYNSLCRTADGNFAIANYYQYVTEDWDDYFITGVCKFDEEMNILWYRYFRPTNDRHRDNMQPMLVGTADSGLVVRSAMYFGDSILEQQKYKGLSSYPTLMYKLDKYGNTVWTDTIFYKTVSDHFTLTGPKNIGESMIVAHNGDIIMGGLFWYPVPSPNTENLPDYRAWLCRYSPDGHKKWEHYYLEKGYAGFTDIYDIEEAENGDIVCIGGLENKNGKEGDLTWLLRVDSMGCHPGIDCNPDSMEVLVDIKEVIKYPTNMQAIEIYPNPAKTYINIKTSQIVKWKSWTIYDFEEHKIKTGVLNNKNKIKSIDIAGLKSGIYFVLLKGNKGRVGLGKFVVE